MYLEKEIMIALRTGDIDKFLEKKTGQHKHP